MRTLSCKEAGEKNCDFVAKGDTDDEVMRKAREHAQSAHHRQITEEEDKKARSIIRST